MSVRIVTIVSALPCLVHNLANSLRTVAARRYAADEDGRLRVYDNKATRDYASHCSSQISITEQCLTNLHH
jgi:hypothetical protein